MKEESEKEESEEEVEPWTDIPEFDEEGNPNE